MSERLEVAWSLTNKSLQLENHFREGSPGYFDQTNVEEMRGKKELTCWKWLKVFLIRPGESVESLSPMLSQEFRKFSSNSNTYVGSNMVHRKGIVDVATSS